MSITRTGGSGRPSTRSGSSSSRNLPVCALCQLSSDGVALPSTHTAPLICARMIATSRAWYRGASSDCLYVPSCSSSTMIAPRSCTGANTLERAPTTMRFAPLRSARHASNRSPSESAECSTATRSPKWLRKRATVCGVSAISGTSTIAPRPCRSTTSRSSSM